MNIMQMRRGMGGGGGGPIYKEYNYLKSRATNEYCAAIDTLYIPNGKTRCVVDTMFTIYRGAHILGGRVGYNNKSFAIGAKETDNYHQFFFDYGQRYQIPGSIASAYTNIKYTIFFQPPFMSVNNQSWGTSINSVQFSVSISFFAYKNANSFLAGVDGTIIYNSQIYDNNNLVRDYIPCELLQDTNKTWDGNIHYAGELGMWDKVHDIFYGNASGNGYFEVG